METLHARRGLWQTGILLANMRAMPRVLYRLCIAVLALAIVLAGWVPCFADSTTDAAANIHSQHQHAQPAFDVAMPLHADAHDHHHLGIADDALGSPSSQHPASHDHGCLKCCALCSAATVSAPTLPEATLTVAGHAFFMQSDQLTAVQVLLDPGIPKASA